MFGVWLAGAVFVPVNPRSPESERRTRARRRRGPAALLDRATGFELLADPRDRTTPDVAFVTWTSGTTGAPKPVLHTHTNYLELLDRVLAPLRGDGARRDPRARRPTPNLVPVSLALNAGIYNVLVRTARRRRGRRDGRLRPARVRGAGRAASRSARRCCRPRRWRCCPTTRTSSTSRRCATCAASPRRSRRCRRAGSPTSSASSC